MEINEKDIIDMKLDDDGVYRVKKSSKENLLEKKLATIFTSDKKEEIYNIHSIEKNKLYYDADI